MIPPGASQIVIHRVCSGQQGRQPGRLLLVEPSLETDFDSQPETAVPVALAAWLEALARSAPLVVYLDDVNFADEGEAHAAIAQMDGAFLEGRTIRVNEAQDRRGGNTGSGAPPRDRRPAGGGYRGGPGGGAGGGRQAGECRCHGIRRRGPR